MIGVKCLSSIVFFVGGFENESDLLMNITSFGILVYSVFTIVAGCLNDNSYEPPELVIANGISELVQVSLIKYFPNNKSYGKIHCIKIIQNF